MTRPRRDTANIDRPGATRRFDLVERDTELELLEAAFERATTGRGSVVLVAGEPGIGKTSLIGAFAEELGDRARMFFGSCEDLLAPRTLGPFRDMLRDAGVETPDLRDRADRDSYIDIWHDLMTFEMRPAVVAIDDAHWADDGTLDLIRYFGRRIDRMPTVLIVTYRPSPGRGKLARILGALVGPETARIELHGLSDQAVTTIALAAGADPASVVPVAGGNPFYLSEILASPNTSVPVTVRDAVTTRLLTLPDDTRLVLEVLSVAPEGADHAMLEAVAGVDAAAAVAAEMAGFIAVDHTQLRFRHELARRAVTLLLSDGRRLDLYRRILDHLTETDADTNRILHYAAAAEDAAAIARFGPPAADEAAAAGAHREALTCCEISLDHSQLLGLEVIARLHDHASVACHALNRFGDAYDHSQKATDHWRMVDPEGEYLGRALLQNSRMEAVVGRPFEARKVAEEALRILEALGPGRDLARAAGMLGSFEVVEANPEAALTWCNQAIAEARRLDEPDIETHALMYRGLARIGVGDPAGVQDLQTAIAMAIELDHGEYLARAAVNLTVSLIFMGRHPEAIPYIELAEQAAREHGFDYLLFHVDVHRSHVELFTGEWGSSEQRLRTILDAEHDPATALVLPLTLLGRILIRRGDHHGRQLIERAWKMAVESRNVYRMALSGVARIELAWLDDDRATITTTAENLLPLVERANLVYARGEILRHLVRLGEEATPFVGCPDGHAAGIDSDHDAAAAAWDAVGNPYEAAVELCESATEATAFEGLRRLDDLGATATAARYRRQLRERGVAGVPRGPQRATRDNPARLTPRQIEILRLVADGLTSPEIAERLYLSRRTVDNHVAAIVSRLGADSRSAAAAEALERGWLEG
ncbi:MAG: AAA family ATPase [Acidimicrobiia bacterium]